MFLIVLGGAYDCAADVGGCLEIADRIEDCNAASAFAAFTQAGARLATMAEGAATAGRRIRAPEAYMQAANYTFAATYFADPAVASDRFASTWLRHQELWDAGAALLDPPIERVRIPFQGATLPGYFFRCDDADGRRPLWPGQSQLYDALPGAKTLVRFGAEEGADLHCEPKAAGLRAQRVFDWLDDTLTFTRAGQRPATCGSGERPAGALAGATRLPSGHSRSLRRPPPTWPGVTAAALSASAWSPPGSSRAASRVAGAGSSDRRSGVSRLRGAAPGAGARAR